MEALLQDGSFVEPRLAAIEPVVAPDASERPNRLAPAPAKVSVVAIEMANVVYDATLWWRWLAALLARFGVDTGDGRVERRWIEGPLGEVRRGRREFGEALEAFLSTLSLSRGEVDELLTAALSRRRDLEFNVRPFPGAKAAFARLKTSGLRLAILSDSSCTTAELEERIKRLGLGDLFEVVLSSLEIEATKPQQSAYHVLAGRLGASTPELCFVSRCPNDLAGATAAGCRTVGFNTPVEARIERRSERFDELCQQILAVVSSSPSQA